MSIWAQTCRLMSDWPADLLLEVGRHGALLPLERPQRLLALVRLHQRPVFGTLQERLEARLLLGAMTGEVTLAVSACCICRPVSIATLDCCLMAGHDCSCYPAMLNVPPSTKHAVSIGELLIGCILCCAQQPSPEVQNPPNRLQSRTSPSHGPDRSSSKSRRRSSRACRPCRRGRPCPSSPLRSERPCLQVALPGEGVLEAAMYERCRQASSDCLRWHACLGRVALSRQGRASDASDTSLSAHLCQKPRDTEEASPRCLTLRVLTPGA